MTAANGAPGKRHGVANSRVDDTYSARTGIRAADCRRCADTRRTEGMTSGIGGIRRRSGGLSYRQAIALGQLIDLV